jgi:protein SCO1/2
MIANLELRSGVDYSIATVSFDPTEGPDLALKAKQSFGQELGEKAEGWSFLTGDEGNIQRLMKSLGFGYKLVDGEYAHSAVIYILTADGILSQYFLGVDFYDRLWDIRLSLVSAAEGKIGSLIDQAALYCFMFDPTKGKYSLVVFNLVRGVALLGLIALVAFLSVLWSREWAKRKN